MEYNQPWGLIARHLSGESTTEEEAELTLWLNDSEENRRQYQDVKLRWDEKQPESAPIRLHRGKAMVFERIRRDKGQVRELSPGKSWQRSEFIGQVAAALLIMVLGWYGYTTLQTREKAVALKKVENAGQPKEVLLPDGSTVWLNSKSRIQYSDDFSGETREVYLEGEAFFSVQRDESKPFIVHTGTLSTRVLGTSFNIEAYPEQSDIKVTVSSGRVSVFDSTGVIGELIKDQQIAYQKTNGRSIRQLVQAHHVNKWKEHKLIFEGETFGTVARTLEHRYHVDIQFSNKNIENSPVTAQFDSDESLQQILYMLGLVTDSKSVFQDETHIFISSKTLKQ